MRGKTIIITGASDGIGAAAARQLKSQGAEIVVVGRSASKTEAVAREISSPYYLADFARLDDVRKLAAALNKDFPRIDVLANNAGGIMGSKRKVTVDGNELTIQVNHLAPFLLTNLLMDKLANSKATVIATSSAAHKWAGKLDLNDINLENDYKGLSAYGKTKLMNILFTKELHKRFHSIGISAVAFHPGVVRTNFSQEFGGGARIFYSSPINRLFLSPEKGADTLVWVASTEPEKNWKSGMYYHRRKIRQPSKQAEDAALATELWDQSTKLAGLT